MQTWIIPGHGRLPLDTRGRSSMISDQKLTSLLNDRFLYEILVVVGSQNEK